MRCHCIFSGFTHIFKYASVFSERERKTWERKRWRDMWKERGVGDALLVPGKVSEQQVAEKLISTGREGDMFHRRFFLLRFLHQDFLSSISLHPAAASSLLGNRTVRTWCEWIWMRCLWTEWEDVTSVVCGRLHRDPLCLHCNPIKHDSFVSISTKSSWVDNDARKWFQTAASFWNQVENKSSREGSTMTTSRENNTSRTQCGGHITASENVMASSLA